MKAAIHHMTITRYYDKGPWDTKVVNSPSWNDVETAIRKMDNYYFPIVQLFLTENTDDEDNFMY